MIEISADVFSLSKDAVVLLKSGKVHYANPRAIEILGSDCRGKSAKKLFGNAISNSQGSCFTTEASFETGLYTACVSRNEQYQVIFLYDQPSPADYIGERFWTSMRDGLMNLGLSLELWREHAGEIDDQRLKSGTAAMTHSYYRMSRMLSNASYILDYKDCCHVPSPVSFDMSELFRKIHYECSFLFPKLEFSLNCPQKLNVCTDRSMICTAVMNLISNSVSHAEGCTHISLNLADSAESIVISVSDNGCGIEPEMMPSVFSRYKEDTGLVSRGTGFGLSVVKNIARSCGGTLLLESRIGVGTTVRMSISTKCPHELHSCSADYAFDMHTVLLGLADCLPNEAFEGKYMD